LLMPPGGPGVRALTSGASVDLGQRLVELIGSVLGFISVLVVLTVVLSARLRGRLVAIINGQE